MNDGKTFLQRVAEREAAKQPTRPTPPQAATNGHSVDTDHSSDTDRERRYALGKLRKIAEQMATTTTNRNDTFNLLVFKLSGEVRDGKLSRREVEDAMLTAGRQASALGDHPFTDAEMEATLRSAFDGGDTKQTTATTPPPREQIPAAYVLDEIDDDGNPTEAAQAAAGQLQNAIRQRALQLRIDDKARLLFNAWQATELGQGRPTLELLCDFLATPDEDATYRITDLLPIGGNVLLAAQQKAGKTSMIANLIRTLADGGAFLDKFHVRPVERLTLIDNELDERMLRRWLREQGICNTDRVQVVSLKGNIATFDLNNEHTRAQWAEDIRGSQFVILDCLRPCLDSLGLSEDKDAGRFLVAWDALKKEAGVSESVVVHHMGHNQERSRGDSRLMDWPDVNWKIIKESQSESSEIEEISADGGRRFFTAHGRDVMVPEGLLKWNETGRTLTYIDGGRREAKAVDAIDVIRDIMSDPDNISGLGVVALTGKMRAENIGKTIARRAIKKALDKQVLLEMSGARNTKILTLNPSEAL